MNANTRRVVKQMFTEDYVFVDAYETEDDHDINIRSIAEALMADNVRVKKLQLNVPLSIGDAQALRDALHVIRASKNSFLCMWMSIALRQ
jgi:hypothetical protein